MIPLGTRPAALLVTDPNGNRTTVPITALPFRIGRQAGSELLIRDSRASRNHAQIVLEDGEYVLEDTQSRHGTLVNGQPIKKHFLQNNDVVELGKVRLNPVFGGVVHKADQVEFFYQRNPGRRRR